MKKSSIIFFALLILSVISGWLLSKASLIGRTGINLFYKEYQFLKVWWQGALVVLILLLILWMIHQLIKVRFTRGKATLAHSIALVVYLAGLYLTYNDFRTDLSHRLLGERFHLGAYFFWIAAIMLAIVYLLSPRKNPVTPITQENFPENTEPKNHTNDR